MKAPSRAAGAGADGAGEQPEGCWTTSISSGGRIIGRVLSAAVNLLNPAIIVIGGDVAEADQHLLAGIREAVYGRSTPLATRALLIEKSVLGDRAGIIGAAIMVSERLISPEVVDEALASDAGRGGGER